ncbi:hypothetical protein PybrP1_006349 [[Pythium] brassicae (nom. inval.)]|nr:hypothetical protein PybrP1_006349 [[Pythium] brassicae (nom. inval.)]
MLGPKLFASFVVLVGACIARNAAADASQSVGSPVAFSEPQSSSFLRSSPPQPPASTTADSIADVERLVLEYAIAAERLKTLAADAPATPVPSTTNPAAQSPIQQNPGRPQKRCSLEIPNDHLVSLRCNADRIRFIGLGDWGETTERPGVLAVRDGVLRDARTGNYDFILSVGDNFYDNGVLNVTDPLWKASWFDRFRVGTELTLPWISFLGNHDHYGKIDAQLAYGLSGAMGAKYWIMPSKSFSVDAKVATGEKFKIVIPDTMTLNWTNDAPWVTQEFNDPNASFVFAAGHHHVYSSGGRGDNKDASIAAFNRLIQSTPAVKGYLAGHEHDMQYMRAAGKDYFMFGGGGREVKEGEVRPGTAADTVFYAKKYGYALFDVDVAKKVVAVTYHVFNATGHEIDEITFTRRY